MKFSSYLIILAAIIFVSCFTTQIPMEKIIITKSEDFKNNYYKQVTIEGYYRQMNVNKRPGKTSYSGRVYIELADSQAVALESHEKGVRGKEEIQQFDNKKVRVTGMLKERGVLWGDGSQAAIVEVMVKDIKGIEEVR